MVIGSGGERGSSVVCVECCHFQYFSNAKKHNSPHALGECPGEPWDGNRGQWAMLRHPCRNFVNRELSGKSD
jgi:hypothetical protein